MKRFAIIAAAGAVLAIAAASGQDDAKSISRLRNPAALTERSPVTFKAAFDTSKGRYDERPDQRRIEAEGNAYLMKVFPNLDYVKKTAIVR